MMATYTKIELDEILPILKLYPELGPIKSFQPLANGISNTNYKLEAATSNFVLKISNDKSESELAQELAILHELNRAHYPYVVSPLQNNQGSFIQSFGDKHILIFPFIDGVAPPINAMTCVQIGQALAQLHNTKLVHDRLRRYEKIAESPKSITAYIESSKCLEDFKQSYLELVGDLSFKGHECSIIHGDLYFDNTLFKKTELVALVDFEQAGYGPCILDLGISISGTCLDLEGNISAQLIEKFLIGYEAERPLQVRERVLLKKSILFGLHSISLWRIKRFVDKSIDPTKKDNYKELLKRARNFNQCLMNEKN